MSIPQTALASALLHPRDGQPRPPGLLRESVYEALRDAIVEGRLAPGEKLRDGEIAQALEVSRMPVREALRRLADEGLVVAEASRWTKVAPLDFAAAVRVYPIIWSLECLALELAGPFAPEQLGRMTLANQALEEALRAEDPVAANHADTAFHDVILDAAQNPEIAVVVGDMKTRIRRIEVGYFGGNLTAAESCREHAAVIDALGAGDLSAAKTSLELNWSRSRDRALRALEDGHDRKDPA